MTVRKWIILIVSALLILALILYFVPLPKPISVQLPGTEVDKKGNVIAQGEIVLEGIYFDYLFQKDRFRLGHLELPNLEGITVAQFSNGYPTIMDPPSDTDNFIWIPSIVALPIPGKPDGYTQSHFAYIFTRPDFNHFVVRIPLEGATSRYFIGTNEPSPDYGQILEEFYQ